MEDGNTAAIRQHERSEDRAQSAWDAYAPGIIKHVRQELLDDETLKRAGPYGLDVTLREIMLDGGVLDELIPDLYTLLRGDALQVQAVQDRMKPRLVKLINEWIASRAGQEYIARRVREADEAARNPEE